MATVPTLPGLYYEQVAAPAAPSPLRSDVAGFVGRTRRGETGRAVRVEGWREYVEKFGSLAPNAPMTYAIRGYFENGGQVAWIARVVAPDEQPATAEWLVAAKHPPNHQTIPIPNRLNAPDRIIWTIVASSAGQWAHGLRVAIEYSFDRGSHAQTLTFTVRAELEPTERFRVRLEPSTPPQTLISEVARQSKLIRVRMDGAPPLTDLVPKDGRTVSLPSHLRWNDLVLDCPERTGSGGKETKHSRYRAGLSLLLDETEVAIVALPDLAADANPLDQEQPIAGILKAAIVGAADLQDRIVIVDVPEADAGANDASDFADNLRGAVQSPQFQRAAVIYHPWLRVNDPLGGNIAPLRTIPPSGHIAGVISRVDRERGAHHTPANVLIDGAVDLETSFDDVTGGLLSEANVNLIRCVPGHGLAVWGGRTLSRERDGRFLGHRRFIHRLVRAIRRVAEPLAFETNGPEQWLTIVRAVSTVLLEAFRTNALQGSRPEEAFRVRCDERTNPLSEREQGRMLCEIDLALAVPMEFITLRVAVSQMGQVEVFDE